MRALSSAAPADDAAVRFQNVGLRYGAGPEVLRDISFTFAAGSFHFITGASGAGKTSLLRLMDLDQRASRGFVALFGQDVGRLSRRKLPLMRRRIGVVYQDFRLLDHLSVIDNVCLPLRIHRAKDMVMRRHAAELLDWVGLGEKMAALPSMLSGGEQQRAALARAVIANPDLLIADEPTGSVDPLMADRLLQLMLALNRNGMTVVVATHDERLIERGAKPVLRIERGEIISPVTDPAQEILPLPAFFSDPAPRLE